MMNKYEVIVIGSGIAALTIANCLYKNKNVILYTKSNKLTSNSYKAQGGVAAAMEKEDTWEEHFLDTLTAGVFHNDVHHTELLTKNAIRYLTQLINDGMEFDQDQSGRLRLGREGGHMKRRILHSGGDATGKNLMDFMFRNVQDKLTIVENEMVIDLIVQNDQCIGIVTKAVHGEIRQYFAPFTIIATGGAGQIYKFTSNVETITGDGIAMAYRAGAVLADMEFMQFHPTILYKNGEILGLVSEAVRGEGGFLQNSRGERFMEHVHELKDLAPRDIVAKAIYQQLQKGYDVFLNITQVKNFANRFPTINRICRLNGIDPDKHLLPVIPGAHFMMGGIKTDEMGQTTIKGLFAVGEAACTGVHGANRLASNSLLEAIVFGHKTAEAILTSDIKLPKNCSVLLKTNSESIILPTKQEIKEKMIAYAGIERNEISLKRVRNWLESFDFFNITVYDRRWEEIEIVNMLTVAWLIVTSALERKESIGSHYRTDYPKTPAKKIRREITRQIQKDSIRARGVEI
jgi:L-aspartate oxidase